MKRLWRVLLLVEVGTHWKKFHPHKKNISLVLRAYFRQLSSTAAEKSCWLQLDGAVTSQPLNGPCDEPQRNKKPTDVGL